MAVTNLDPRVPDWMWVEASMLGYWDRTHRSVNCPIAQSRGGGFVLNYSTPRCPWCREHVREVYR